jgi:hypothetical protein
MGTEFAGCHTRGLVDRVLRYGEVLGAIIGVFVGSMVGVEVGDGVGVVAGVLSSTSGDGDRGEATGDTLPATATVRLARGASIGILVGRVTGRDRPGVGDAGEAAGALAGPAFAGGSTE